MSKTAWLCCAGLGACNDADWVHRALAVAVYPASKVVRFRGNCAMARSGGVRGYAVIDWGEMNVRNSVALLCLPRCM